MANKLASAVMANIAAKNGYERKIPDSLECDRERNASNLDAKSENLLRRIILQTVGSAQEEAPQQNQRPEENAVREKALSLDELAKQKRWQ